MSFVKNALVISHDPGEFEENRNPRVENIVHFFRDIHAVGAITVRYRPATARPGQDHSDLRLPRQQAPAWETAKCRELLRSNSCDVLRLVVDDAHEAPVTHAR